MSVQQFFKFIHNKSFLVELLILLIITIPAFFVLLQPGYLTMHDDQHIVRLYLFDHGFRQGQVYPRWVDGLGFGFGYPLFNFYPPFIYFIGEMFHLLGFSFIWSIKLVVITGFVGAAVGVYLFTKKLFGRLAGFLSATLYTYFFYHAVNAYVRGAFAEFFSMTILPFVFLTLYTIYKNPSIKNRILFGISLSFLILAHPLIAFPSLFYIGIFALFPLVFKNTVKEKINYLKAVVSGGLLGLCLSMFFWLPSLVEKQYTLVNTILTQELASYKLHFIYPIQFLYSLWGYGGSGEGMADGMTYQLGKIHIALLLFSVLLFFGVLLKTKKWTVRISYFVFFLFLLFFSLFMTVSFSGFIWSMISYLWYLQFPWRFLTFVALFISVVGGATVYLLKELKINEVTRIGFVVITCVMTVFIYSKYFKPLAIRHVTDKDLTTFEEVSWRISGTSFEFVPRGVKTVKSHIGTTQLDIQRDQITTTPYNLITGTGQITQKDNLFHQQSFEINASTPIVFRLNTYNFTGWSAYIIQNKQKRRLEINDNNKLKLITVNLPPGSYILKFVFEDTFIRIVSNTISLGGLLYIGVILILFIKNNKSSNRQDQ